MKNLTSVSYLLFAWICLFPITIKSASAGVEPYCGLYSMHSALHAFGIQADFSAMVSPQYLSGPFGSTADDLVRLARQCGATGTYKIGMSIASLRAVTSPVILHTSSIATVGFNHWVAFLGIDGDCVKLYDSGFGTYTLSSAELLSIWDGIGVVVALPNDRLDLWTIATNATPGCELILAFLLVFLFGELIDRVGTLPRCPAYDVLIVPILAGVAWHSIIDYGYFGNRTALANVANGRDSDNQVEIDLDQFRNMVGEENVTIVDARFPLDYGTSHVNGAINIPITSTYGFFRTMLSQIPMRNQVVVYCQSEACGFADSIAQQFVARGYKRVSVFRGGMSKWMEWLKLKNHKYKVM